MFSKCLLRHDVVRVVPCASFCTGHFVMVPLNMTYLHCLQHSLFEHLFNLYFKTVCCQYKDQYVFGFEHDNFVLIYALSQ